MQLEDAVREFEGQFTAVIMGQKMSICEAGEPYVTICSCGPKGEGDALAKVYDTEVEAVQQWLAAVKAFSSDRPRKILYWRRRPTLEKDHERAGWTVKSRLALTN